MTGMNKLQTVHSTLCSFTVRCGSRFSNVNAVMVNNQVVEVAVLFTKVIGPIGSLAGHKHGLAVSCASVCVCVCSPAHVVSLGC